MEFKKAVEIVISLEGGYHHDKRDPGGETKYGISKRSFPKLDIKNLTKGHAQFIYQTKYWNELKCEGMPKFIRLPLFDCGVNQSVIYAKKTLQRCLGVKIDGIIGNKTLAAVNNSDSELLVKFTKKRVERYFKNKNFSIYGKGWINRVVAILSYNYR